MTRCAHCWSDGEERASDVRVTVDRGRGAFVVALCRIHLDQWLDWCDGVPSWEPAAIEWGAA
jgi:hypothetical protein